MLTFRELFNGLRQLEIERGQPILAHASLSAFGEIHGGADTLLGAVLSLSDSLLMPAFTYKTLLIPEVGPANNGIVYGRGRDANRMAEFFNPEMPADPLMGVLSETLRRYPRARRSLHPILSFVGLKVDAALDAQTLTNPLAPIATLSAQGGWALLLGVDHTVNTAIHYAEKLAGRRQFVRWALTRAGVVECPGFPGCSDGFQAVAPLLEADTRRVMVGATQVQAIPLAVLIEKTMLAIANNPLAFLCSRPDCERCQSVRNLAGGKGLFPLPISAAGVTQSG